MYAVVVPPYLRVFFAGALVSGLALEGGALPASPSTVFKGQTE